MKKSHMALCIITFIFLSCTTPANKIEDNSPRGPQYRGDTDFHPRAKSKTVLDHSQTVCFDESHNNLAVQKGFYNPILELIESDGYKIIRNKKHFDKTSLKTCNILYISAVLSHEDYEQSKKLKKTSAFSDREIKEIHDWVQAGGSLLFMTDHKPMGSAAGKLLAKFGVRGSDINVRNPKYPVPPFKDDGIFLIPHSLMNSESPIVRGRNESEKLNQIYFFYGQALKGPSTSDVFLKTGPDALIGGLYNEDVINPSQYPAVAIALKVKKGRLVVFGDATVFTSKMDLWMNEPTGINRPGSDNIQMALNVFHWLSGILN